MLTTSAESRTSARAKALCPARTGLAEPFEVCTVDTYYHENHRALLSVCRFAKPGIFC